MEGSSLQVVEKPDSPSRKRLEAYHIAPLVRQLIADEFLVMKSTRRLAKKYRLPRAVVQDIVALHPPRKRSASAPFVFAPRRLSA